MIGEYSAALSAADTQWKVIVFISVTPSLYPLDLEMTEYLKKTLNIMVGYIYV